uniref:H0510A06.7 protein n=1 Tax=Oryza sativa TaxID=4530 RepID=Q25AJ8_ORYSA|nr:H0510A06.7 [Oryza sativa]
MARGSAPLDGSVLPPSRIVSERQAGLPRRFIPESVTGREVVELGEGRPAPHYPGRSVFFLSFAMAGLVPPFSSFFKDVLELYDLQMAHLTPNAVMTLAIFAHLCEMFIGVRPSLWLFRWFFTVQPVSPPSVVGGCYFQPRGPVLNRYIPCVLRKKWDDWKSDWFYTPLTDEAHLRLPSQPLAQASSWRAPVDLGDGYDAVLDRLAGLRSQGLTGAMVYGDYLRRRIAPLGPDPSGDVQDEPASGDAPESGTSIGGPSHAAPTPRRLSPLPSTAPPSAEPLLQALAAANTTVLDGLSAQMEVLQAERVELDAAWARVEEGWRSVEAMVEAGRKAHRRHASELEARRRELAEIAREVEEERETALIATAVLNEARDDLRLQYGSRVAELEKKLDAARGVLDAAAAREWRAAENEAASRRREEALKARATALEERARARERDLADREAAVAIREATLAAHEAACAEEESALRLREDALTERERALEEAEAAAQRLADSLSLREAAREEQARRNLEGARAERAALDQRAAELEALAKELDARARSGGAAAGDGDLAARLAAAEHTIADLQGALDSSAGEVEALRLAGEVGPGMLRDAVSRLDRAGWQAGLWGGRTAKYAANQGGLAQCLSEMAGTLQRLPEELEETIKSSSRDLARGAVELVLVSYQARDPDFSPWAALDEFPPGTEDDARA